MGVGEGDDMDDRERWKERQEREKKRETGMGERMIDR